MFDVNARFLELAWIDCLGDSGNRKENEYRAYQPGADQERKWRVLRSVMRRRDLRDSGSSGLARFVPGT